MKFQQGFTLIEVVVALGIFAMLGLASYKVVHSLALARDTITKNSDELRHFVRAMNIINDDFTQLSPRKIMDQSGKDVPAFDTHGKYSVEFTRIGMLNPLMVKKAKVARIAYRFSKELDYDEMKLVEKNKSVLDSVGDGKRGYLMRYIWPVLDRGSDKIPEMQILLVGIDGLEFEYMDDKKKWHDAWPSSDVQGNLSLTELPYAIKLKIVTNKYGPVERLFQIHELPQAKHL